MSNTFPSANIWQRLLAQFVDLFTFAPLFIFHFYNLLTLRYWGIMVMCYLTMWLMKIIQEWYFTATLGKMLFRLKIIALQQRKSTFKQILKKNMLFTVWIGLGIIQGLIFLQQGELFSLHNLTGFVPGLGQLDIRDLTTFLLSLIVILHFLNNSLATLTPHQQSLLEMWAHVRLIQVRKQ